jgi:hypothetical protein
LKKTKIVRDDNLSARTPFRTELTRRGISDHRRVTPGVTTTVKGLTKPSVMTGTVGPGCSRRHKA